MTVSFGLHLTRRADPVADDPLQVAREWIDEVTPTFTTLWLSDHFQDETPNLESWTFLSFLAATFPTHRFGTLVLGQRYRNPALMAKMAATLQYLTAGRLVFGIGAGWHEEDHAAYGYELSSRGARVQQLRETIEICRAMWQGPRASYEGQHYRVKEAYCAPLPDPAIPILVGTAGPKALRVVAELADMWHWDIEPQLFDPAYETLKRHCDDIERPLSDIAVVGGCDVHLPADVSDYVGEYDSGYEGIMARPLGPTVADAIQKLERAVDLGVTHFTVAMQDLHTARVFCDDVAPAFV